MNTKASVARKKIIAAIDQHSEHLSYAVYGELLCDLIIAIEKRIEDLDEEQEEQK